MLAAFLGDTHLGQADFDLRSVPHGEVIRVFMVITVFSVIRVNRTVWVIWLYGLKSSTQHSGKGKGGLRDKYFYVTKPVSLRTT